MNVIDQLVSRYPQLTFPIEEGMHETEKYKNICLRGIDPVDKPDFITSDFDSIETVSTPAGDVEVLFLYERADFEHAYCALANRCEPMKIPASTGAVTISGLNNWDKVRSLTIPLSTADKNLYKDYIILLSNGPYSNVFGESFGIEENQWLKNSFTIRKYHEITHFISRHLYIDNMNAIRDEVMADMIGIIYAFGKYDVNMARTFLGIEGVSYRENGRLQNYTTDETSLEDAIRIANQCIDVFSENLAAYSLSEPFNILISYEEEKLGL